MVSLFIWNLTLLLIFFFFSEYIAYIFYNRSGAADLGHGPGSTFLLPTTDSFSSFIHYLVWTLLFINTMHFKHHQAHIVCLCLIEWQCFLWLCVLCVFLWCVCVLCVLWAVGYTEFSWGDEWSIYLPTNLLKMLKGAKQETLNVLLGSS